MVTRRLVYLVSLLACAAAADAAEHRDGPVFQADLTGVGGSTFDGDCFVFLPRDERAAHLRCVNLLGGRTPNLIQIYETDRVAGEPVLISAPFSGGSTFEQDVTNVPGRVSTALRHGYLGIRFLTGAGTEAQGTFQPSNTIETVYPLFPLTGDRTLLGICEVTAPATTTGPFPFLGTFCDENFPGAGTFAIHADTTSSRGPVLFQWAYEDMVGVSNFRRVDPSVITAIITQTTNANLFNSTNWIGGNNLSCRTALNTACLNDHRFRVQVDWRTAAGQAGQAEAGQLTTDAATFWSSDNVDFLIQVLNRCPTTNRYWVFAAGTTSLETTVTVTDTRSGQTKTYLNPQGTPFAPIQDTAAFATCP